MIAPASTQTVSPVIEPEATAASVAAANPEVTRPPASPILTGDGNTRAPGAVLAALSLQTPPTAVTAQSSANSTSGFTSVAGGEGNDNLVAGNGGITFVHDRGGDDTLTIPQGTLNNVRFEQDGNALKIIGPGDSFVYLHDFYLGRAQIETIRFTQDPTRTLHWNSQTNEFTVDFANAEALQASLNGTGGGLRSFVDFGVGGVGPKDTDTGKSEGTGVRITIGGPVTTTPVFSSTGPFEPPKEVPIDDLPTWNDVARAFGLEDEFQAFQDAVSGAVNGALDAVGNFFSDVFDAVSGALGLGGGSRSGDDGNSDNDNEPNGGQVPGADPGVGRDDLPPSF